LNISPFIFFNGNLSESGNRILQRSAQKENDTFADKLKNNSRATIGAGLSMQMSWISIEAYFNLYRVSK